MRVTTSLLAAAWFLTAAASAQESQPAQPKGPQPATFEVPAAAWTGVQREAATLRWAPEVGQVVGYRALSSVQLVQDYNMEDAPVDPVNITSSQAFRLEVTEVTDAHVLVSCQSRELAIELSASGMTMTTDTRDGTRSGNPGLDLYADLVGEPFLLKVTRAGHVEGISDLDDLHERLTKKTPFEDLNVKELVNGERLAQELQPFFLEFGPAELKSGARWAVKRSIDAGGGQRYSGVQTYVYLGLAELEGVKCVKLVGQFTLDEQLNEKAGPNDVKRIGAEGQPYAIYVDSKTGAVIANDEQVLVVSADQNMAGNTGTLNLTSKSTVTPLSAKELGAEVQKPDWNKQPPK